MAVQSTKTVLDAGPLITSTREELLARNGQLFVPPSVLLEIRDEAARSRLNLIKEDLTVQQPSAGARDIVKRFASSTGDVFALSSQDLDVVALAYDLTADKSSLKTPSDVLSGANLDRLKVIETYGGKQKLHRQEAVPDDDGWTVVPPADSRESHSQPKKTRRKRKSQQAPPPDLLEQLSDAMDVSEHENKAESEKNVANDASDGKLAELSDSKLAELSDDKLAESSDDDGWITPSNLEKSLQKSSGMKGSESSADLKVAIASRDFAVQNLAMRMGLAVVNDGGVRIKRLRSAMQRCHACFKLVTQLEDSKVHQFCPQCGGHTLSLVAVSVDKKGQLRVHLKADRQWVTRGDRYTLPSPQSNRSRRKQGESSAVEFYAEDQPEYVKAVKQQQRQQRQNAKILEDFIGPSTVDSAVSPFATKRDIVPAIRIGRGRNPNAPRRRK